MSIATPMNPAAASTMDQSSTSLHQILKLTTIDIIGGIYCHICHVTFSDKKNFDTHYMKHNFGSKNSETQKAPEKEIIYTCVQCHKEIMGYPSFRGHCYTSHVIKNRFKCSYCFKQFSKLPALEDHVESLHKFKCLSCNKEFSSKKEWQVHKIIHKKDIGPLKCTSCNEVIDNVATCEYHIDKHSKFTYLCPICNETITKLPATEHLKIHFGNVLMKTELEDDDNTENMFNESSIDMLGGILCCYCAIILKNRAEIDMHFEMEHEEKDVVYSCNICRKQYDKYLKFANHCYNHLNRTRLMCDKCFKTFPRLSLLVSHVEACQTNGAEDLKPFKCMQCNHKFSAENRLKLHLRDVHGLHCFKCSEDGCKAIFNILKDLILHQSQHKNGRQNRCSQCGLHFTSLTACEKHFNVHRKKQFSCPICNRRYGEKYLALKHIPQHFEAVLHFCTVCGKMFKAKSRLAAHIKTHSVTKNFNCHFCGKGFSTQYNLKQHLNVHTGLRPYKCVACEKSFTSYPNWFKHVQRMHKIDPKTIKKPQVDCYEDVRDNNTNDQTEGPRVSENGKMADDCNEYDTDTSDSQISNIETDKQLSVENRDMLQEYDESEIISDEIFSKDSQVSIEKNMQHLENNGTDTIDIYNEYETMVEPNVEEIIINKMDVRNELPLQDTVICTRKDNYNIFTETMPNEGPVELESIEPSIVGEKPIFEANITELTNVLPTEITSAYINDTPVGCGVVSVPPEYGPEFMNVGGLGPPAGQVIDLDDHLMPHIDPRLTTRRQGEPLVTKVYADYSYGFDLTDIEFANRLPVMNTDIY